MTDTDLTTFPGDRYADTETITLTDEQRRRAEKALEALKRGGISEPNDLVDWKGGPIGLEEKAMALTDDYFGEGRYVWISGEDITGASREGLSYFKNGKLQRKLEWLLAGTFEIDHYRPPQYASINGDLYVTTDGLHRSIAFKAAGIDCVRVWVVPYHIPEPGYRYWCSLRDAGMLRPVAELKDEAKERPSQNTRLRDARRRPPQHYDHEPEPDGLIDRLRQLIP